MTAQETRIGGKFLSIQRGARELDAPMELERATYPLIELARVVLLGTDSVMARWMMRHGVAA